jgi:uncharacterized protein with PIN domain
VDFSYQVKDDDYVSIYPASISIDVSPKVNLQPQYLEEPRFVLDNHLGKLASYLRMLGFDTLYRNDYQDEKLALLSSSQNRILLTRDQGLLKRNQVIHGYWVREIDPRDQVLEIIRRYNLAKLIAPFKRCIRCNGLLTAVPKADVVDRLEPRTKMYYTEFRICQACEQIYWKGSHYAQMERFISQILDGDPNEIEK